MAPERRADPSAATPAAGANLPAPNPPAPVEAPGPAIGEHPWSAPDLPPSEAPAEGDSGRFPPTTEETTIRRQAESCRQMVIGLIDEMGAATEAHADDFPLADLDEQKLKKLQGALDNLK